MVMTSSGGEVVASACACLDFVVIEIWTLLQMSGGNMAILVDESVMCRMCVVCRAHSTRSFENPGPACS